MKTPSLKFLHSLALMALAGLYISGAARAVPAVHTEGNQFVTANGGHIRFTGVDIPSLDWSSEGEHVLQSVNVSIQQWHANLIRLPLCQDRWMGMAGNDANAYRSLVDQVISSAASQGCYVLLDIHFSDEGSWGNHLGGHFMPDDNTNTTWVNLAGRYANNPAVLFDAYNEPHDVDWSTWRNGGTVNENGVSYHTPGMQGLVNTIRATGANNVIAVGGLDWAYDLTGVVNGYAISGSNIAYSAHVYPWKTDWDAKVSVAAKNNPIIIGEFGTDPTGNNNDPGSWMNSVLSWMDAHNYSACAWDMHPTSTPSLITDWNYTPSGWFGVYVKNWLAQGGVVNGGLYKLTNVSSGLALDDTGGQSNASNPIEVWDPWSGPPQQWSFTLRPDGAYTLTISLANMNLDDPNGSNSWGQNLGLWYPNTTTAQEFRVNRQSDGSYTLVNVASGLALDDPYGAGPSGTLVQLWGVNGTTAQEWFLTKY